MSLEEDNLKALQTALREAYVRGKGDGIDIISMSLRKVSESDVIALEDLRGFLLAVSMVEESKKLLGLE